MGKGNIQYRAPMPPKHVALPLAKTKKEYSLIQALLRIIQRDNEKRL